MCTREPLPADVFFQVPVVPVKFQFFVTDEILVFFIFEYVESIVLMVFHVFHVFFMLDSSFK